MVLYESGYSITKKENNCLRKQIIAAGDINNQKLDHRQKPTKQFEQIPLETIIQNRYSGISSIATCSMEQRKIVILEHKETSLIFYT